MRLSATRTDCHYSPEIYFIFVSGTHLLEATKTTESSAAGMIMQIDENQPPHRVSNTQLRANANIVIIARTQLFIHT